MADLTRTCVHGEQIREKIHIYSILVAFVYCINTYSGATSARWEVGAISGGPYVLAAFKVALETPTGPWLRDYVKVVMPRPEGRCPVEPLKHALEQVKAYLDEYKIATYGVSEMAHMYFHDTVSALEVMEMITRLLEGHPPLLVLEVAKAFFPEYTFECSLDPETPLSIKNVQGMRFRSLFHAAKKACEDDRHTLRSREKYQGAIKSLLPYLKDRPHILDVFRVLSTELENSIYGRYGHLSRVVLLIKDDPLLMNVLNVQLARYRCGVKVSQRPDGPSPAVITKEGLILEFVSSEGCSEVLSLVDEYREARLRVDRGPSVTERGWLEYTAAKQMGRGVLR